jgi:GT2 family glycosyltransferase
LERLDYPDYETIVVDDGSTDDTQSILKSFPGIRVVRQTNQGLSAARNAGIWTADGEIVAFTDSDCVADPDWLYHLAREFENGDFVGVGGPNLTPEENRPTARSISLAPGHATHVLLAQDDAEHIPGCNMAFRRDALIEMGGFDPLFWKAGDDVDIAWRLQDMGFRIGFSTSAFVWHHRRPAVKGYLKQQIGYGEAEALLSRKHPHRFNDRGQSIWGGAIYAGLDHSTLLAEPNINYGIFGSAGFQCVYEKRGSGLAYLLTSLEWWLVCATLTLAGFFARPALFLGLAGLGTSVAISGIWAFQKWRATRSLPAMGLPTVWLLWILQPLVREGSRQWFRYRSGKQSKDFIATSRNLESRFEPKFVPTSVREYWSEEGSDRLHLLQTLAQVMSDLGWSYTSNTPWEPWDFSVRVSSWFKVRVTSAEENHGGMKRLLKLRFKMLPTSSQVVLAVGGLLLCLAVGFQNTLWARWIFIGWLFVEWFVYRRGCRGRSHVESVFDSEIRRHGFLPMEDLVRDDRGKDSDKTKTEAERDGEFEPEEELEYVSK